MIRGILNRTAQEKSRTYTFAPIFLSVRSLKAPLPMPQKRAKRRPAGDRDALVAEALRLADRPVGAYELIERLRDKAVFAPQTVYRALDRLIATGHAHRLESLNAFVACKRPSHSGAAVFAICEGCGAVTEFSEPGAIAALQEWARRTDFTLKAMTLELRGTCAMCAAAGSESAGTRGTGE